MALPDVAAWSGLELVKPLAGGVRSPVYLARHGGRSVVVRESGRDRAALDWELDLLAHLRSHGLRVPQEITADNGRRDVAGVLVQEFLPGQVPRSDRDWRHVVDTVAAVHELTRGWPQRPGFASARDLLTSARGGDVDLTAMPAEAVDAVRAAWMPVLTGVECVVHGDAGGNNVLIDDQGVVALLDWDESRVDVPWFDFAHLPTGVDTPAPCHRDRLTTAGVAWEAATSWRPEPDYAARRLSELYDRLAAHPASGD